MDDVQLDSLVAEARVQEAAARRGRQRWLQQQAVEEATLVGVLLDLAESVCPVVLRARGGGAHRGSVVALGRDHVVIGGDRTEVMVRLSAVVAVTSLSSRGPVAGDRGSATGQSFRGVLSELSARQEQVKLGLDGGRTTFTGVLLAVSRDLVLVSQAVGASVSYIPLDEVDEVVVT